MMSRPPASGSEKTPWHDWTDILIVVAWSLVGAVIMHNLMRKKTEAQARPQPS